jgi:hypothetical protein
MIPTKEKSVTIKDSKSMPKLKGYPNPKPKAKVRKKPPKQKPVKLRTY